MKEIPQLYGILLWKFPYTFCEETETLHSPPTESILSPAILKKGLPRVIR
jgi:hypothetical protein